MGFKLTDKLLELGVENIRILIDLYAYRRGNKVLPEHNSRDGKK